MRKIGQMLPAAIEQAEVLRIARAQAILRHWPEVVGPLLAERSWPDRFSKGTVWVAVQGSAWAQELRMMKDVILERLAKRAGDDGLFKDVRFGVRPPRKLEPEPPPPTPAPERQEDLSIREIAARRLANWKGPKA